MTDQLIRQIETPDSIYGRLQEALHISGYSGERALSELDWLLDEGRWKIVGPGFEDINDFLAVINLSDYKLHPESRKSIVKKITSLQASQRATARMLGVDHKTISRDLGENSPKQKTEAALVKGYSDGTGENSPDWEDIEALHQRSEELLIEMELLGKEIDTLASRGKDAVLAWVERARINNKEWMRLYKWAAKYYPEFEIFLQAVSISDEELEKELLKWGLKAHVY